MKRLLTLPLFLMVLLPGVALVACTEEEEATPTPTATVTTTPTPAVTPTTAVTPTPETPATPQATPTPTPSPPPAPQAMLSGKVKVAEPGVVVTEDGEELRVSLSDEGGLWRFESGDPWTVSRADGTVLFSGTVVGEAYQYEGVTGFVRLDDGRAVAYSLGNEGNWYVYPADETCRRAEYYIRYFEGSGSVVLWGLADKVAICREELGITEGIPETP
ncbi:MAG: hypothetical protein WBF66_13230 [Dehalococcoidia bacterium]